jgi:starch phosphorylase
MSIIDEDHGRRVRMANLATVGSHAVNGVAAIHSRLLTQTVMHDFAELWPDKFTNVTNGVTPRRFVVLANPTLSALITEAIGEGWPRELERLRELEPFAEDAAFRERWRAIKLANKKRLASQLGEIGLHIDPQRMLDVQVKRIHEYKRQHMNLLHAVTLFQRIGSGVAPKVARTILIGGKAAPGYWAAKLFIRLAHAVAARIHEDPEARRWLSLVFVPNFNVKMGEHVYPAADLSQQISTAGMEASGTGNMKLALNGALTVGTLEGANIEIRERVGDDNIYIFGLTAEEVAARRGQGYLPRAELEAQPALDAALRDIAEGAFAAEGTEPLRALLDDVRHRDRFMVVADFAAYAAIQRRIDQAFAHRADWTRRCVLNTARMGWFSSDRAIRGYARDIWQVRTG